MARSHACLADICFLPWCRFVRRVCCHHVGVAFDRASEAGVGGGAACGTDGPEGGCAGGSGCVRSVFASVARACAAGGGGTWVSAVEGADGGLGAASCGRGVCGGGADDADVGGSC